jgi:hypothetical protein
MLALGFPLALMQSDAHHQPFAGYGALAWAVFVVLGVRTCCLRQGRHRGASRSSCGGCCGRRCFRCWPCGAVAKPIWHRAGRPCW